MQAKISPSQGSAGSTQTGLALQLFVSHLLAGCAAIGTYAALLNIGLHAPIPLLVAVAVDAVVGVALTLNIVYGVFIATLTVARFAQGLPVEPLAAGRRWPLHILFLQLNAMNERIQQFSSSAQLTDEYREQLLRQASEDAAREERSRIARDLHDSIKQQIFSISMSAAAAKAHWKGRGEQGGQEGQGGGEDAREAVEDIQRSAKEAQVEMQALLQQLRASPLENTSLVDALRTQAEALGFRTGAKMVIDIGNLPASDRLLPGTQETLFRIAQEAFSNIARHARAGTVWLTLKQQDNALYLEIRDDGQGFDSTAKMGMGLGNLRERARSLQGDITIHSASGQGTTIQVTLPLLESLMAKKEEQERVARDIQRAKEQAIWGFQLTENIVPVAFVLIILHASLLIIILSILAALYGCGQAYYYRTRVAVNAGRTSMETISLQQRENNALLLLTGLCTLVPLLAFLDQTTWQQPWHWWLLAATGLFFALVIYEVWRRYRGSDHYLRQMPWAELGWELGQRTRGLARRTRFWLIGIFFIAFFSKLTLVFPPATPSAWSAYADILGFGLFGVTILLDYRQTTHWKQRAAAEQARIEQEQQQPLKGLA